jgi:pentatricopeptide repeat protein
VASSSDFWLDSQVLCWIGLEKGVYVCAWVFVGSSLVYMYGKCGIVEDAMKVFDGIGKKKIFKNVKVVIKENKKNYEK